MAEGVIAHSSTVSNGFALSKPFKTVRWVGQACPATQLKQGVNEKRTTMLRFGLPTISWRTGVAERKVLVVGPVRCEWPTSFQFCRSERQANKAYRTSN